MRTESFGGWNATEGRGGVHVVAYKISRRKRAGLFGPWRHSSKGCWKVVEAEVESEMIVRRVRVNRALTPVEAIAATGRIQYVNADVLGTMPRVEGEEEVDVYFFQIKRFPHTERDREFARRGFVLDPYAQIAVNRDDPSFADEYPNRMEWGKNFLVTFCRWRGRREVETHAGLPIGDAQGHLWWFGGVHRANP